MYFKKEQIACWRLRNRRIQYCRENGISVSGGKIEIIDRIAYFLGTEK